MQSLDNPPALPSLSRPSSEPTAQPLAGLRARIPTGLAGAVFWLGLWFCVLFVGHWIHGGFGTFLGILQFFVGVALVAIMTWHPWACTWTGRCGS